MQTASTELDAELLVRTKQFHNSFYDAVLAGLPGLSLPCGRDNNGLPIGLQLIGQPFGEEAILRAGDAYERTGAVTRRAAIL